MSARSRLLRLPASEELSIAMVACLMVAGCASNMPGNGAGTGGGSGGMASGGSTGAGAGGSGSGTGGSGAGGRGSGGSTGGAGVTGGATGQGGAPGGTTGAGGGQTGGSGGSTGGAGVTGGAAGQGGAPGGTTGAGGGQTGGSAAKALQQLQSDYVDMRFGMFMHFGILTFCGSQPGDPCTGSWAQANLAINNFTPSTKYNPSQWADAAVAAHMKFGVLTTRHHDGFALWPSAASTFNVGHIPWKNGRATW